MNPVVVRIIISFFVAGAWIAGTTLIGERLGARKAGLISNLPSNILISLLFVALTKGPEYASDATAGVPTGMLIDTIFLVVFIFVLKYGIIQALTASLATWAVSAAIVLKVLPPMNFIGSTIAYVIVAVALFIAVRAALPRVAPNKKPTTFSWKIVGIRAFFAGTVVAGAVTIAQFAPPYMTGIFATFPAALTSSLVILALSQGVAFTQATGKILIISSTNLVVYVIFAGILFPLVGPWLGTLVSFAAAFGYILLMGKVLAKVI
jgi:hypothetical protein